MKDTACYNDRWQRIPFKRVAELLEEGQSYEEIAAVFGIPVRKARVWCWRARNEGYTARKPKSELSGWYYVENCAQRRGVARAGSMPKLLGPLDKEVLDWLMAQTPDGAIIADTIRAIVTDAYHEENP